MDSNASDGLIGAKRPAEHGEECQLGFRLPKRARSGGDLVGNVRKAAEIVLVLAAMGRVRGGRKPTEAERKMAAEAREKVAEVCGGFAPKNVFGREGFGLVVGDLGLNKLREQNLGFRIGKMSIAETVLFAKKKMEKSEELSSHSAVHSSQRLQSNFGAAATSTVASRATRIFPLDKPGPAPSSIGVFQPASPLGHVSAANSTILPYQLPASEARTPIAKVDSKHFRLDPRSNGASYALKIQANSSGDPTLRKPPTWSQQFPSASSGKPAPGIKDQPHPPIKVEGTAITTTSKMAPQAATSKPLITLTTTGNPLAMHQHVQSVVQAPSLSNAHLDICNIVQKLLQPQLPKHPAWTPPSRDFMNKALTCQVCKLTINEVENVFVCDACEKGYHQKCLQSHNTKAIPRGEWHCLTCLSLSNGKPIPPKYGRVTRNINAPKEPSNTIAVQSSPEKKVETLIEKGKQQKMTANGSSGVRSAPAGSIFNNHKPPASGSNMPNAREIQGNDILLNGGKMNDKVVETCPNDVMRTSALACVSSAAGSTVERQREEKLVSEIGQSRAKLSETITEMLDHSQASSDTQDTEQEGIANGAGIASKQGQEGIANGAGIASNQGHDSNLTVKGPEKSDCSKSIYSNRIAKVLQEEQGVVQPEPIEISGTGILAREQSSDSSNDVDWIGDRAQVVDGKTHYHSCCINGVVYKVQDYALFRLSNDKEMPYNIQAMWEDNKTRSKWVTANRCYFPGDLPETVGHPCSPESNEVYESNHGDAVIAGLIRGPCEVLPPGKFTEEMERRSRLGSDANGGLLPLFLCKWIYDESRGVFRDVSS